MKEMIKIIIITLLLCVSFSCFDDGGSSGPKGTIKITVKTSSDIWGYPSLNGTDYEAYSEDNQYTFQYPETGGDGIPGTEETLFDDAIGADDVGDKKNVVYLYSSLGDKSSDTPVLYKGVSTSNNQTITIDDIEPGVYYVAAFYDYCGGGNLENQLNRYDRYTVYTDTDPEDSTANSTPFKDHASTVTVTKDQTTEITLEIKRDWLLGKPKTTDGGTGRIFLATPDPIPTCDGVHL